MDPIMTLGQILPTEQNRDAIHLAIAPVIAAEKLLPGEHVGLDDQGQATAGAAAIGIVDPFLTVKAVRKGERCWLMLYPNTITSLRHEWIHPAFNGPQPGRISKDQHREKSERWIEEHADLLGLSSYVLMENAQSWLVDQDYFVQDGSERWRDNFNPTEFWHHFEVITGKVVDEDKKMSFYCCTC